MYTRFPECVTKSNLAAAVRRHPAAQAAAYISVRILRWPALECAFSQPVGHIRFPSPAGPRAAPVQGVHAVRPTDARRNGTSPRGALPAHSRPSSTLQALQTLQREARPGAVDHFDVLEVQMRRSRTQQPATTGMFWHTFASLPDASCRHSCLQFVPSRRPAHPSHMRGPNRTFQLF